MAEGSTVEKYRVRFLPDNIETIIEKGTSLLEAALAAGVHINAYCGGTGVCGTCKVKIESGRVESKLSEKITQEEYNRGLRLACRTTVLSDLEVTIPVQSRLGKAVQTRERVKGSGIAASGWTYKPPFEKRFIELSRPSLDDNVSDLFRLMRGLKDSCELIDLPIDFEVIKKLPGGKSQFQLWKQRPNSAIKTQPAQK
jgi:uncharacterized 2Fe-2S/4Fe-4S cluster protein (DUF4445 family)